MNRSNIFYLLRGNNRVPRTSPRPPSPPNPQTNNTALAVKKYLCCLLTLKRTHNYLVLEHERDSHEDKV
jgi:hypothetical protein